MCIIKSYSVYDTENIGKKISKKLKGKEVIAFYGGLGMGKTALIRGMASGLGSSETVSSPTFSLVNEYNGVFKIYHFDMYRINTWEDLESIGFFDYLDLNAVIAIEWSENIEEALPENTIKIFFEKGKSENERILKIEGLDIK